MLVSSVFSPARAENLDQQISQLINVGKVVEAYEIFSTTAPSEIDSLFFWGRIYKATKQFPRAIETFAEVLRLDSNHINARRELAHTRLLNGEYQQAESDFKNLVRADNNEEMRNIYRSFLSSISRNKPRGFNGTFRVIPSTNINRGTTNTIFNTVIGEFEIDNPPESGVGIQVGLSGFFRYPVSQTNRIVTSLSITSNVFSNSSSNSIIGELSSYLESYKDRTHWSIGPYIRHVWARNEYQAIGMRYNLGLQSAGGGMVLISGYSEQRKYSLNNSLGGFSTLISVAFDDEISTNMQSRVGIKFGLDLPEANHLEHYNFEIFTQISKKWRNGVRASLGTKFGGKTFFNNYLLLDAPRMDFYYGVNASLSNSSINILGFSPQLSCSYTRNGSNVAFFKYQVSECGISIASEF